MTLHSRFITRILGALSASLLFGSLALAPIPVHAAPALRIAVVLDDERTTSQATEAAVRARIAAALHDLIGQAPAVLYWLPITDASYGAPVVSTIVIPAIPPLRLKQCTPFDVQCRHDNDARTKAHQAAVLQAQQAVDQKLQQLRRLAVPRAQHTPDVMGAVARATQLFTRTSQNYLIVLSAMDSLPPASTAGIHLRHADLDVVWTAPSDYAHAHSLESRWQAMFHTLGVCDQYWAHPEQVPLWSPIGKS